MISNLLLIILNVGNAAAVNSLKLHKRDCMRQGVSYDHDSSRHRHAHSCRIESSGSFPFWNPPAADRRLLSYPLQRNLPNKRQFGKQDPYCVVVLNGETRKTKIIKRGGQHPEWDEEIRFTIFEDSEALRGSEDGTPPPLPPKAGRGPKKIQGGKTMAIACFAADREPELIGEATVDLTEALTKGETDGTHLFHSIGASMLMCHSEWFTLLNKDKYSGEVYLELTFWSNVRCFIQASVILLDCHSHSGTTSREESDAKARDGEQAVRWPWRLRSIGGTLRPFPAEE